MPLELTTENINAVSLEMTTNKTLFEDNINHVLTFMIKTFPEKDELLSKIKVLNIKSKAGRIDSDADVMEQIAMNIFLIKKISSGSFAQNMRALFLDKSTFSRVFLIYFYRNSDMSAEQTGEILDVLTRQLLETTGLVDAFQELVDIHPESGCSEESEETEEAAGSEETEQVDEDAEHCKEGPCDNACEDHSEDTVVSLVSLNDSDEIRRIDTTLATMFKREKTLSSPEITSCTKILDVMEVILENNYLGPNTVIPAMLCISGNNQAIFKRAHSVVKIVLRKTGCESKSELCEMFCRCLELNAALVKMTMLMVDTCGSEFDWPLFFGAVNSNSDVDLGLVDRRYIPNTQFYRSLAEMDNPQRFRKVARNVVKSESDADTLIDLVETIDDHPEYQLTDLRAYILSRIKEIKQGEQSRTEHEKQQ